MALAFLILIPQQVSANQFHPQPVIDDEMGILSDAQKQQIMDDNAKLAKLKHPQQIWVVTSNEKFKGYDNSNDPVYYPKNRQTTFSYRAYNATQSVIANHVGYNKNTANDATMSDFDLLSYKINIIFVSPKQKPAVAVSMSENCSTVMGDLRDIIMTTLVDNDDISGSNVTKVANQYTRFMSKHLNSAVLDGGGPDSNDIFLWSVIILIIIIWLIYGNYQSNHPHRGGGGGYSSSEYDVGFDDGWFMRKQNDDNAKW